MKRCVAALAMASFPLLAAALEIHPLLGVGVTAGGDGIGDVLFDNRDEYTLRVGKLVDLKGGVDLRFTPQVSVQMSLGYHFDKASGTNGSVTFSRKPIELIGHFFVSDVFRVGVGLRKVSGAKVRGSGVASGAFDEDFESTRGSIVEAEYFPFESFGVKMRYVSEKYRSRLRPNELRGNHGGLYVVYYFD